MNKDKETMAPKIILKQPEPKYVIWPTDSKAIFADFSLWGKNALGTRLTKNE